MLIDVRIIDSFLIFESSVWAKMAGGFRGLALALGFAAIPMMLSGCRSAAAGTSVVTASPQVVASVEQRLEMIPPPSKTQYLAVRTLTEWQNPYLTVEQSGATLHVTSVQRQDQAVKVSDLPSALNALPNGSWPYGRVVAVEEIRGESDATRPAVRRNVEAALKTLGDLGVVAYEWNESGLR